jgi:hypothetical protein
MSVHSVPAAADPVPLSVIVAIAVRYPRWTVWFGQATRRWWALPPTDWDLWAFVEAPSARELIEAIEAVQHRPRPDVLGARRPTSSYAAALFPASQARSQMGPDGRAASPSNTSVTGVAAYRAYI